MLKRNAFTIDTDGERTERLIALSANIGDVAVELGLPAAKVTDAEAAQTDWDTDLSAATREGGEAQEATEELNKVIDAAYDYYVAAKAHLKALIYEIEYPDKIIEAYDFGDDAPTDLKGLYNALKAWIDEHAVLAAAGDPRIVNDTIVAKLTTHFGKLDEFHRLRLEEKHEAIRATATKRATFVRHSKLLSYIHTLACLTWGDDASQLRLIGMVPSSEVWTPGGGGTSPEIGIPQNLAAVIEGENVKISWDAVDGADSYQLVHTEFPPLFLGLYDGEEIEFVHENPPGGTHYYNVRAKKGDSYSEYPDAVSVEITGVKPEPPHNLTLEHVAPHVKVTWESPPSTPQYFRLYIAIVPTGSAPPVKSDEPDTDKIITLSVSIFAPGPGNTVYAWITSFGDGEESDPCGPESIDIM